MVSCIRPMRMEDLPDIMRIERSSHVEPWDDRFFLKELNRAHSFILVAEAGHHSDSTVIGYICFWKVVDEIQIFNLAVDPPHRRRGIGRALLLEALATGCRLGARIALLEVRRSNEAARSLYEGFGFKAVGLRHGYYKELEEPAILMELEITPEWRRQWLLDKK